MSEQVVVGELCNNPNPTITDLNNKAIKKLYDLLDGLDVSDPEGIIAVTSSIARLNTSVRNNVGVLPQEQDESERLQKRNTAIVADELK